MKKMTKDDLDRRMAIEQWLDKQIEMMYDRINYSEVEVIEGLTLETCDTREYVHLYNSLDKIVESLDYLTKVKSEGDNKEWHFYYKGVQFVEVFD